MAARASANVMTEEDADDGVGSGAGASDARAVSDLPEGLSDRDRVIGGNFNLDGAADAANADHLYEIIDEDSPASGRQNVDQSLTGDQGEGAPLIESGRGAETPAQAEHRSRKATQRARRREGRDRTLSEVETLRSEVQFLKDQVGGITPRLTEFDQQSQERQVSDLNRSIEEQTRAAASARRQLVEASTNGDHEGIAAALDARDSALMKANQLTAQRNMMVSGSPFSDQAPPEGSRREQGRDRQPARPVEQRQTAPQIPPAVRDNIQDFASEFAWYNPGDPNSAASQAVLAIDRAVAAEGFDPAGQDYWDELRERMREELPTRYFEQQAPANGARRQAAPAARQQQQQPAPQPQRRGPVMAGPADRGGARPRVQVHLTKDRKEALMEVGVLARDGQTVTDRPKFMRYLKQFSEYDSANGGTRQ